VVSRRVFAETGLDIADAGGAVRAPMHGKVLALLVDAGASVRKGQRVALIEAMKMEHALTAPCDGVVAEVAVEAGSQIAERGLILRIVAPSEG
jgi:3-methylcrotonyl-CoA carboxylase alpha subunit